MSTPLKYNSDTKYNAGHEYNSQAGTDLVKLVAESLGLTEAVNYVFGMCKVIAEAISLSETFDRFRKIVRHKGETLNLTETMARVRALVRLRAEALFFPEQVSRFRARVGVVAESINLRDTWRRFRYNARHRYNKTYIRYTGQTVYVIRRGRTRMADEMLTLIETMFRARNRVAVFVHDLRMTEILGKAIDRTVIIIDSLRLADTVNYFRQLCRAVAQRLDITETVLTRQRALATILAVAITKAYLIGRAITRVSMIGQAKIRQVFACTMGGATRVILEIYRGNDKAFEVSMKTESGQNLNLAGATVYFMVKETVKDADEDAVITKTSADSSQVSITNATGGLCEVYLEPEDTAELNIKRYVYEVKVETEAGKVYTVAMNEFVIKHVVQRGVE